MTMPMTTSSTLGLRAHERSEAKPSRYLCFGRFHVDLEREELFKDGARVRIPAKVYQVLLALVEKPGDIVTRECLRSRLWPVGTFVNYDANVNTTVNKLRLVLGDSPDQPLYVETVPRQGYCFVASVERRSELTRHVAANAGVSGASKSLAEPAPGTSAGKLFNGRLPGFFASGWAAVVLLCGVLLGMGIVLYTHRPS